MFSSFLFVSLFICFLHLICRITTKAERRRLRVCLEIEAKMPFQDGVGENTWITSLSCNCSFDCYQAPSFLPSLGGCRLPDPSLNFGTPSPRFLKADIGEGISQATVRTPGGPGNPCPTSQNRFLEVNRWQTFGGSTYRPTGASGGSPGVITSVPKNGPE